MDKQENIFEGKTAEEAVESGLTALGLKREDVEVEVLNPGKKKLFGYVPAQVKLTPVKKLTDGERAVEFLEGLFERLDNDGIVVTLAEESEKIVINLDGATKGVIGRRGEVIDAVQVLAGAVANTGRKNYMRVVVDCGNYREEREETLKRLAEKLAAKAVRLGKRVRLEPMNPYERRIIHAALVDSTEVTTKSEGKEPARYVVIIPNNMKQFDRKPRGDRNDRGGRGGYKNDRGSRSDRGGRGGYKNDRGSRSDRGGRGGYKNDRGSRYGEKREYPKRDLPEEGTPESSGTSFKREGSSLPGYRKGGFNGFFGTYLGNVRDEDAPETSDASGAAPVAPDEE